MELKEAYKLVLDDMLHNGPTMFQGNYDAINGNKHYMYGIRAVMDYIAIMADPTEKLYEQFGNFFDYNMWESKVKKVGCAYSQNGKCTFADTHKKMKKCKKCILYNDKN